MRIVPTFVRPWTALATLAILPIFILGRFVRGQFIRHTLPDWTIVGVLSIGAWAFVVII